MIEQGLYFALGFLVAALLALAILPAFWRRAYRLTRREIEATLPLSPREIAAERDQLRAKFAVERVQLEQRVEAAKTDLQRGLMVTGGKATEIAGLQDELAVRQKELAAFGVKTAGLELTLEATRDKLAERETLLARTQADKAMLETQYQALDQTRSDIQNMSDERRIEIAAHRTNLEAQKA